MGKNKERVNESKLFKQLKNFLKGLFTSKKKEQKVHVCLSPKFSEAISKIEASGKDEDMKKEIKYVEKELVRILSKCAIAGVDIKTGKEVVVHPKSVKFTFFIDKDKEKKSKKH